SQPYSYRSFFLRHPPPPSPLSPYTPLFRFLRAPRAVTSSRPPFRATSPASSRARSISLSRRRSVTASSPRVRLSFSSSTSSIEADRESTRLNPSHQITLSAIFCLNKNTAHAP